MQKKIRDAETKKIPYMVIIGDKEVKSDKIAVRSRRDGDLGLFGIKEFVEKLKKEIDEKKGGEGIRSFLKLIEG